MKNLLIFIMLLLFSSCGFHYEEPVLENNGQTITKTTDENNVTNFIGHYVTEDLNIGFSIYDTGDFAYEPDQNNFGDWTTWRIGRYELRNDTMIFHYKDNGKAYGRLENKNLLYFENDIHIEFLPSSKLSIDVTIDPNFRN